MSLSPEARRLLAALRRGEIVSRTALGSWMTSGGNGGEIFLGSAVYSLVQARLAEYFEWAEVRGSGRIGTAARLKPRTEQEAA